MSTVKSRTFTVTLTILATIANGFAQINPEVLYYRFDSKSLTNKIVNYATQPPSGTDSAELKGSLALGDTGLCGNALVGTGAASSADFVDTKWATQITGSWTYAMWIKKIPTSSTLFYIFGDVNAGSFRCFTNGVAGPGNWILRGPFTDLLITGGANMNANHLVFVYNDTTKELKGYLNGTLNKTIVLTASPSISSTGTLKVCGYSSNVGLPSGGLMDNFMVFNYAVSASDVSSLFTGATYTNVKMNGCESVLSPSKKYSYTKSGIYYDTLVGFSRCDSVLILDVKINNATKSAINPIVCNEYTSPSKKYTFTKSGNYFDTLVNTNGCDSIIEINLTVNYSTTNQISKTVCNSYTSPTGKIYTITGIYSDTLINSSGCDSFIITNLTVNQSSKSQSSVKVCDFYVSPTGKKYTSTGLYVDTLANSNGCDSFITTDLTVLNSTSFVQNITECDSFTSPTGKKYTITGIYNDTLTNAVGCDSILTTNLTIHNSVYIKEQIRVCGTYRSPKGNLITQSGFYIDTLTTINGCDSIYAMTVTIDTVNNSVTVLNNVITANQLGATYQWLDCGNNYSLISNETSISYAPEVDGNYAVEVSLNTCKDTSNCVQLINVSAIGLKQSNVRIYPSPTTGDLYISNSSSVIETIELYQINGQKMDQRAHLNSNSVKLDLSKFPAGVYIIEVTSNGQKTIQKIVKNN